MSDSSISGSRDATGAGKGFDAMVVDIVIRLAFLGLLAYWTLSVVGPFVTVVLWGIVLAVALYPVFAWIRKYLGGSGRLSAVIVTVLMLAIVLGPTSLLATALIGTLQDLSQQVGDGTLYLPPPMETVREWPLIGESLYEFWLLAYENLEKALARIAPQLKGAVVIFLSAAASTGLGLLQFGIAVIIAGALLVPAPLLTSGARSFANRVISARGEEFVSLAAAAIRNVARGVIGISLLQSLLIGVGLLASGIPFPGALAFGALILGIVQIGPGILVLGTVVWAWMELETVWALAFTAYMIPVSLLDNVLKPIVMSHGLSTPMLVIFIGVVGGTLAHGILGLFLGPIVMAVAYELLLLWVRDGKPAPESATEPDTAGEEVPIK